MLSMFLMAGALFVTSCSDDETTGPTLDLKGSSGYTSDDVTISAGSTITIGVIGTAGDKNLSSFTMTSTNNNVPYEVMDTTLNSSSFNLDIEITFTEENLGANRLLMTLADKDGNKSTQSFTVTVENGAVAVKKASSVEFGSFNDAIGSFYNTTDMALYTVAQAKLNQAKVDFLFYKGAQNGNTIAAPDDVLAATEISTFQLNTWTTRNATRFAKGVVTAAQFDAITTTFDFPEFNSTSSDAAQLADGDVVFFQTVSGKLGLIKVVDLYTRGDRAKFDIIVQE